MKLAVGLVAKVVKNEIHIAGDSGTVPRQAASVWEASRFVNVSWVKAKGSLVSVVDIGAVVKWVQSGLKVREVESLQVEVVRQSTIWVSHGTPNKHLQPNCYRPFYEIQLASQVELSWNKTCWPAIG
jgi:hypothetical protein